MEYIYAALLLNSANKEVTEEAVKAVLVAGGIEANDARVKALVAALEGVDIAEAIAKAAIAPVAAAPVAAAAAAPVEAKKEEKKEDTTAAAAAGLGALFM